MAVAAALPGAQVAEGLLIDKKAQRFGTVERAAAGHNIDNVEHFEGIDGA